MEQFADHVLGMIPCGVFLPAEGFIDGKAAVQLINEDHVSVLLIDVILGHDQFCLFVVFTLVDFIENQLG